MEWLSSSLNPPLFCSINFPVYFTSYLNVFDSLIISILFSFLEFPKPLLPCDEIIGKRDYYECWNFLYCKSKVMSTFSVVMVILCGIVIHALVYICSVFTFEIHHLIETRILMKHGYLDGGVSHIGYWIHIGCVAYNILMYPMIYDIQNVWVCAWIVPGTFLRRGIDI